MCDFCTDKGHHNCLNHNCVPNAFPLHFSGIHKFGKYHYAHDRKKYTANCTDRETDRYRISPSRNFLIVSQCALPLSFTIRRQFHKRTGTGENLLRHSEYRYSTVISGAFLCSCASVTLRNFIRVSRTSLSALAITSSV